MNTISEHTYEFLNDAYTKLLDKNAYLTEENDIQRSSIQTLSKQVVDLQAKLNETYIDENNTIWTRPTAWAYYSVCKALNRYKKIVEDIEIQNM